MDCKPLHVSIWLWSVLVLGYIASSAEALLLPQLSTTAAMVMHHATQDLEHAHPPATKTYLQYVIHCPLCVLNHLLGEVIGQQCSPTLSVDLQ